MSDTTDNPIDGRGTPAPASHTPGPWQIVRYGEGDNIAIHSDEDMRVCFMATAEQLGTFANIKANARLIAAAPAMLVALRGMVDLVGGSAAYRDGSHSQTVVAIAEGAIALAEGR